MYDLSGLNDAQRQAVTTTEGPLLIIAGPGTGKTHTLVQRAIYLIEEKKVAAERIMIVTFTEKAAKELITRITNETAKRGIAINLNEMYIGTFHSLCLRMLKDNVEYTDLGKNYTVIEDYALKYLLLGKVAEFEKEIAGFKEFFVGRKYSNYWKKAAEIVKIANKLEEEAVNLDALADDEDKDIRMHAEIAKKYRQILEENNCIDFARIQSECYKMLKNHSEVLDKIRSQIEYIMVDEYQDTDYIQEQIVLALAGEKKNLCVVGDDDQGMYRFRGATIRNILEFPAHFEHDKYTCKRVFLEENYRSHPDIVGFYNGWMHTTSGNGFSFEWGNCRFDKKIRAHKNTVTKSPAVISLKGDRGSGSWKENVYHFIRKLKDSGKITDYNQIAFLFRTLTYDENVKELATYLEKKGINVYAPRSSMFFMRDEIKLVMGCLIRLFPSFSALVDEGNIEYLSKNNNDYYKAAVALADKAMAKNPELGKWIKGYAKIHRSIRGTEKTTDYNYSALLYRMLAFEPFKSILDTPTDTGVNDLRPLRNLSAFIKLVCSYENAANLRVLSGKYIEANSASLFRKYFKYIFDDGLNEYEDDSEYAPGGCVSFLTIHQSKGLEFPVVIVGSLDSDVYIKDPTVMDEIEEKYFHRRIFEPKRYIGYFDLWRMYYTAFSRAQNLLVLTGGYGKHPVSELFSRQYESLPDGNGEDFSLDDFEFEKVKDVNIKEEFSFTSHISVYEVCPLQYKFYKKMGFSPVRAAAMFFGTLVHETIEDIHKAVLRGEKDATYFNRIINWFNANYTSLSMAEHCYLSYDQRRAALGEVMRYVKREKSLMHLVKETEVDVSLIRPDYIISGKIDLIRGEGDSVEIVDFKSEKRPDTKDTERLEHYRRQLEIYAYLVEERTGNHVSRMKLYYTGEENGDPVISFDYNRSNVEKTMRDFDATVRKILSNDFNHCAKKSKTCGNCDFRFYCGRAENKMN